MGAQWWADLIRFGFRLLYNEMAWSYDLVSWIVSLGEWRAWQRAALPYVHGRRVLEIGHGPGHMLLALQLAGYDVVGLDLSAYMGRIAHRRAPSAPLVRGKVQALPFAAAVFDTVLSTFPTEYVVDPETLTAVHRVLRENGRFVIIPEGHLTGSGPLAQSIEWLYRITGQRSGSFSLDDSRQWPHEELWRPFAQRFRAAGFRVEIEQAAFKRSAATILIAHKT